MCTHLGDGREGSSVHLVKLRLHLKLRGGICDAVRLPHSREAAQGGSSTWESNRRQWRMDTSAGQDYLVTEDQGRVDTMLPRTKDVMEVA